MSRQNPGVSPHVPDRAVTGPGGDGPALSRRKFLGRSGAAVLAASTGGWLLAPTAAEASPRNDPYDIATWEALSGERLTLWTASGQETVVAHHPRKGVGRAYSVVLGQEGVTGRAITLHDGTYELEHGRTGRFPLFVVSNGTGRYVATFNN